MRSRSPKERHAFMGCTGCRPFFAALVSVSRFHCDHCGLSSQTGPKSVRCYPEFRCPHCATDIPLADLLSAPPQWTPILVQEIRLKNSRQSRVVIRPPTSTDPLQDNPVRPRLLELNSRIPAGIETDFLRRDGYKRWCELYTNRQLHMLSSAVREIDNIRCSTAVKQRLLVAVVGACEMAASLSRWEAHYPKAYEALANHRYARITVAAETNLLSDIGRGTLPRRLMAAKKAVTWRGASGPDMPVRVAESSGKRRLHIEGALIATGSSKRQLLQSGQVKLVVTDPPYHDDVQYGELARLFHAWLAVAGYELPVSESDEVVPNKYGRNGENWYRDSVTECLRESRRTLATDGLMVLTYHNNCLKAWMALGQSLARAGFHINALATAEAENPADHCKRGRQVFLHDLVIECAPAKPNSEPPEPLQVGRNLIPMKGVTYLRPEWRCPTKRVTNAWMISRKRSETI